MIGRVDPSVPRRTVWRRRARFLLLRAVAYLVSALPRRVGLEVCALAGRLALALRPDARDQVCRNLELVFPAWDERARRRFAREGAGWLGRNLFDFVRLRRYSLQAVERLVAVEGREHLERAWRQGAGVICVSAHLGCWELIPYVTRALGYPSGVVYRRLRDADLDAYISSRRARFGIATHDRDRGARGMLRSLRSGALLGVLVDQHTRVDSVRVPFLGRDAWTPTGAVRLGLSTGAPLLALTIAMRPDGRHTLRISSQIEIPRPGAAASEEEVAAAVREGTALCNAAIGEHILAAKEQWVWFHKRWADN